MEFNSDVRVKNETEEYAEEVSDFEVKVKEEILETEHPEIEISGVKRQSSDYNNTFLKLKVKEEDNLRINTILKMETQQEKMCSDTFNLHQNIGECPENFDVDEKVDLSEIKLESSEYNGDTFVFKSENDCENPRLFASNQSSTGQLHEEEVLGSNLISNKIYFCKDCLFQATNETMLNMHISSIHNNQTIIDCQFCDNVFTTKVLFDDHLLKEHEEVKIHLGDISSNDLTNNIDKHFNSINNEQKAKINCQFCNRLFGTKAGLDNHLLKQHDQKIKSKFHQCNVCSYKSTFKHDLNRHYNSYHNEQRTKINCQFCNKSFNSKVPCDNHLLKQHKYDIQNDMDKFITNEIQTCNLCKYTTTFKKNLLMHINSIHKKQKTRLNCELCDRSFASKKGLNDHLIKQHNQKIKSKIYECNICSYKSTTKGNFDRHYHNEQRTKINCHFCDKSFNSKVACDNHLLKHHKHDIKDNMDKFITNTIHSCKLCSYKTTSKANFRGHVNSIHNKQITINSSHTDQRIKIL